jgi:hypothetical protein
MLADVIHNYLYSKNYTNTDMKSSNWAWNKSKKMSSTTTQSGYFKPTKDLVKFMAMTAPFDSCQPGYNECDKANKLESADYSPIMPGILGLRKAKNTLFCNDIVLVQFIGHSPQGFGATIDLFTSNDISNTHKTYNINLDISNTALSHDTIANLDKLSDNYFYMVYGKDGTLKTHGEIHVNSTINNDNNPFTKVGLDNGIIKYAPDYDVLGIEFKSMIQFNAQTQDGKEVKGDKEVPFDYFEHGKLATGKFLYTHKTQSGYVYTPVLNPINLHGSNRKKRHSYQKTKRQHRVKTAQTKKLKRK